MVVANQLNVLKNEQLCQRTLLPTEIYCLVENKMEVYDYAADNYVVQKSIYIYDLKSDVWSTTARVEYGLTETGDCIFVNDQLIVMGADSTLKTTSCVSVNIYTGQERNLKLMPHDGQRISAYLNNEIYVFGGGSEFPRPETVSNAAVK